MDKKIEIKEEEPLADEVASLNEREFLHEVGPMNTSTKTVLYDTDFDMTVKTEIKSPFIKHPVEEIKTESATCSNNWEMNGETEIEHHTLFSDFGSESEGEFLIEDPLMVDKKYSSYHEMYNHIEIKGEPWTLEREPSSVSDNIRDGDLSPVKSSRLYPETFGGTIIGKPQLVSAEVPTRDTSFSNTIDIECEHQKCDVLIAKEYVHSDQYGKFSDEVDRDIQPSFLKNRSFSDMSKMTQQCSMCERSFSCVSHLKAHVLIHEGKEAHQCKVCGKSFTYLSSLKRHNISHEGKKQHRCNVCNKSFTQLSTLKTHNLVHEGIKPHQCKVCNKSFTQLSTLKTHNLVHEGKKQHKCNVCDRSFTKLSNLKAHYLVHEGKKPHQCKICDKSFTKLSNLKTHYLVHEGKKPHQCKICDKRFTDLSTLKRHKLVHDGKKSHQCKVCDKNFTLLSNLKRHNLIHQKTC